MNARILICLLACVAALAGCAPMGTVETPTPRPEPIPEPRPAPPTSDAEHLLNYFQHAKTLSATDLNREHDSARGAYSRMRTDFNRVRYAMLLSLPNTNFFDEARALEVLEPVSRNQNGQLHGLAYLLTSHLQERKRLEANAQGLQQKLDALKSLERSMIERKR